MKKIGILTYHYSINEGAMLQAWCLRETCRSLFTNAEVSLIPYESANVRCRDMKSALRNTRLRDPVSQLRRLWRLRLFQRSVLNPPGPKLISDNDTEARSFIAALNYDAIIVGSDEVWKHQSSGQMARGFPNPYWLTPDVAPLLYSYAASANKTRIDRLSDSDQRFVKKSLSAYQAIAVRDEKTEQIVHSVLGASHPVTHVVDPTLLEEASPTVSLESRLKRWGIGTGQKTVLINVQSRFLAQTVVRNLSQRGWRSICVTLCHSGVDLNLVGSLDPFEWAELHRHVDLVVTDRFHGSVFAVKARTPLLAINGKHDKLNVKVSSFLSNLGLSSQVYDFDKTALNEQELGKRLEKAVTSADYDEADRRIAKAREKSFAYLKQIDNDLCK